ncbi:MAG: hypothetical protein N2316_02575 [Spirochaetes bacterium]|nr:hypothetical protein [Spirochaetota bacterium]
MNGDALLQNIVNIFIISIILEASIMAIFSVSALKSLESNRAIESTRDILIIIVSFFLCYKVDQLRVFLRTGLAVPKIIDIAISTLVMARMTLFIRALMARLKSED